MDTYGLELTGRRRRRRYSAQFKSGVVQECQQPGVSMAAVALRHGLNANMVRKWVIDRERCESDAAAPVAATVVPASQAPPAFVPLALPAPAGAGADREIRIEVRRAATTVTVTWPVTAASDCATWLRELLR